MQKTTKDSVTIDSLLRKQTTMKKHLLCLTAFLSLTFVSKVSAQYTKLHDFLGNPDGNGPLGALISDGTYLYGMTESGGTNSSGTIVKLKSDGTFYATLLNFFGPATGLAPSESLIFDGTFLYGMTQAGGANSKGLIFKIKPDGSGYTNLLDFNGTNGDHPYGSLISDSTFLYGMTGFGGLNGYGVIFKIKPDGSGYSKLYDFPGYSLPIGSLFSDGTFLYGMTSAGGIANGGIIFKIKTDGSGYSKLLDFSCVPSGCNPRGSFVSDGTFLYGMSVGGGVNDTTIGGDGIIFKIKPDGSGYSKLHDFGSITDGNHPYGSLIFDGTYLYGMTRQGGTSGNGVIFKIKSDGTSYSKMLDFAGITDGSSPNGSFIFDGAFLLGMTRSGGTNSKGTIFKFAYITDIAENNASTIFSVSPNPFSTQTVLQTDRRLTNASLIVYNSVGQTVRRVDNLAGGTIIFHRDNLPCGLYFVRLTQDGNTISADKFVITDK
jgi:uncharacterized repeat protein (TIGR03803 family)